MNRRQFLAYIAALGATTAVGAGSAEAGGFFSGKDGPLSGMWVIDPHAHPDEFYRLANQPLVDDSSTLEKIRALPMNVSSFAALGDFPDPDGFQKILVQLQKVHQLRVRIVRRTNDMLWTARWPWWPWFVPGALLAVEGADRLGTTESEVDQNLETLHRSGVRMVTIMHYNDNQFGECMKESHPGKEGAGLSPLGAYLVRRLIMKRMVIDVAHAHYATLKDIADIAMAWGVPIVDSHTSLTPVAEPDGHRLRTWEEMEIVAETGGLVCTWPLKWESQGLQYSRATILDWAEENYEIRSRLGARHVALGTDGGGRLPAFVDGYTSILDLPKLADAMGQAGFRRSETEDYMGRNFFRVLQKCIG